MTEVRDWAQMLLGLEARWQALSPQPEASATNWTRSIALLREKQRRLIADGLWVSGHSDLMHVVGVAGDELKHSNMLAWLLNPTGRHQLGDGLLRALMSAGWGELLTPETEGAVIEREVARGHRIADLVVSMGSTTLVIENKVWAPESPRQCQDLYELWLDQGPDVRFLLLSLDGHPPRETKSREAAEAWRSTSYPSLAGWLSEHIRDGRPSLAHATVDQYIETLRATSRGIMPFRVQRGGGATGG